MATESSRYSSWVLFVFCFSVLALYSYDPVYMQTLGLFEIP